MIESSVCIENKSHNHPKTRTILEALQPKEHPVFASSSEDRIGGEITRA